MAEIEVHCAKQGMGWIRDDHQPGGWTVLCECGWQLQGTRNLLESLAEAHSAEHNSVLVVESHG